MHIHGEWYLRNVSLQTFENTTDCLVQENVKIVCVTLRMKAVRIPYLYEAHACIKCISLRTCSTWIHGPLPLTAQSFCNTKDLFVQNNQAPQIHFCLRSLIFWASQKQQQARVLAGDYARE